MGFLGDILGIRHDIHVPKRSRRLLGNMVGDVGENLSGIAPLIKMTGKAAIHDAPWVVPQVASAKIASNLIRGKSAGAGFHRPTGLATLGGQMVAGELNYLSRALGEDPSDIPIVMGKDGKLYRNKDGGIQSNLLRFLPDAPDSVIKDLRDEHRGGKLWSEDPLNAPLAFAPVVGMVGKVGMTAKIARSLRVATEPRKVEVFARARALKSAEGLTSKEALEQARASFPKLTQKEAYRIARKEVNRPGYAKRHGYEGGIPDRVIRGQFGTMEGRMRSRSPLGRVLQSGWDKTSEAIDSSDRKWLGPEQRFSSSARAKAAEGKAAERLAKRNEGKITEVEIGLGDALGRGFFEKLRNADLTTDQQAMMSAVNAALEHGDLTVEEAVAARIKMYESVLAGGVSSAMTETDIAKLGAALEKQMDDLTDEQKGIIGAYAGDLKRARTQHDIAETQALRLATRRTPEERKAIRDRLKLNPHVKRSEAEFGKIRERLQTLKSEHEKLTDRIEDLLTRPGLSPSRRNRDLSTATRQLQVVNDALVKKRLEFRDALAWGWDISDEVRRADYVQDIAEGGAENLLRDARGKVEHHRRRVQLRERRLGDREESSNALLEEERTKLDKAFDDMVANPRKSRPVTELERRRIEHEMSNLKHALENPSSEAEFRRAVEGMKQLAIWVDDTGRRIAKLGLDEEGQAGIDATFDARQRLVGEELVRRGILTPEQAKGAYFPHYSMWSRGTAEVGRGHGVGGPIVNGPNLNDYILNMNDNDLQLMQTGMVDQSPTTLGNILRNRLRYLSTHEAVQKLYAEGKEPPYLFNDIKMGKNGWTLIRNPDAPQRKATDRMRMAYEDPNRLQRNLEKEGADTPYSDEVAARADLSQEQQKAMAANARATAEGPDPDGIAADYEDDIKQAIWDGKGEKPGWADDTKNYRIVPTRVAKARLGEAVMKSPDWNVLSGLNTINMILRGTILYSPYLGTRYVTRNAIQNATLLALTQPGAFRHIKDSVRLQLGSQDEKAMFRRIANEGGTVQASAGLPDIKGAYTEGVKKTERRVAGLSAKTANLLGDVADEPFRVASWINYARRYDFKTPDDWNDLMTLDKHAKLRDEISQRVREDLYDFDSATPAERAVMNRIFFLYPFIRASAKWPFMYAREYPIRAAVLSTLSHEAPQEDEYQKMPQSVKESETEDGKNWGIWDPWGPARNQIENAKSIVGLSVKDQGGEGLLDNLHPALGIFADWVGGNPVKDSLKRQVPFLRQFEDIHRGGTNMAHQAEMFMGMETRPPAHIRAKEALEAKKLTAALQWAEKDGHQTDVEATQHTFDAWKKWEETLYRAQRAEKDQGRKLDIKGQSLLFAEYLSHYGVPVPTDEQIHKANSAQLSTWKGQMEEKAFGSVEKPISSMTSTLRELLLKGYTLQEISDQTGIDVTMFEIK